MARLLLFGFTLVSVSNCFLQPQNIWSPVQYQKANLGKRLDDLELKRTQLTDEVSNLTSTVEHLMSEKQEAGSKVAGCPPPYTLDRKANLCYHVYDKGTGSFGTATSVCNLLHKGRLAILNTDEKFSLIRSQIRKVVYNNQKDCFWVGAEKTSDRRSSNWNDGSKIKEEFWAPGEPNNANEECGSFLRKLNYMLNDAVCRDDTCYPCYFVCEIPMA